MNTIARAIFTIRAINDACSESVAAFAHALGFARLFGPQLLSASTPHGIFMQLRELHSLTTPAPAPAPTTEAASAAVDGAATTATGATTEKSKKKASSAAPKVPPAVKQAKAQLERLRSFLHTALRTTVPPLFTFIELFAGIGGFAVAAEKLGGRCLMASEIAASTGRTWNANFAADPTAATTSSAPSSATPLRVGDIRKLPDSAFPRVDLLVGGFPCPSFSRAGLQPGLDDVKSGDLYLEVVRALRTAKPRCALLENVPGIWTAQDGAALQVIIGSLQQCGYDVAIGNMDSANILPQQRKRVYFCCFRRDDEDDEEDGNKGTAASSAASSYFAPSKKMGGQIRPRSTIRSGLKHFAWPKLPLLNRPFGEIVELDERVCRLFCLSEEQWKSKKEICDDERLWMIRMDGPAMTITRGYRRGPGKGSGQKFLQWKDYGKDWSKRDLKQRQQEGDATSTADGTAATAEKNDPRNDGGNDDDEMEQSKTVSNAAAAARNADNNKEDDDNELENDGDDPANDLDDDDVVLGGGGEAASSSNKNSAQLNCHRTREYGWFKFVPVKDSATPRFVTHRECARMQGFPETYQVAQELDVQGPATAQYGNAVSSPMIFATLHSVLLAAGVPSLFRGRQQQSVGSSSSSSRSYRGGLTQMLVDAVPVRSMSTVAARLGAAEMQETVMWAKVFAVEDPQPQEHHHQHQQQ